MGGESTSAEQAGGDPAATMVQLSAPAPKLVVQMTGLLLVVPPAGETGGVQVLLPRAAAHVGWLGFGMGADSAEYAKDLCDDRAEAKAGRRSGICYVDLEKWQVSPLGAGGTVVQDVGSRLPPELVNVTVLSGNEHKANPASANRRSGLVLSAGAPGEPCILASWDLVRYTGNTSTDPTPTGLINRLNWEISGDFARKLVFTSPTEGARQVTLPAPDVNGRIYILLSHVRQKELRHMPPASPTKVEADTDASHFAAFYDLLEKPETGQPVPSDPARRPTPKFRSGVTNSCNVYVSRHHRAVPRDSSAGPTDHPLPPPPPPPVSSLATYGCVLARGEGS